MPSRNFKKHGNIYLPDDKGYDHKAHKKYPWNLARRLAGMKEAQGADIQILGFYIKDKRKNPPEAICKNCKFPLVRKPTTEEGIEKYNKWAEKNLVREPPVFFDYVGEAIDHIKKMNLPEDQEAQLSLVALAPAPDSLTDPMPSIIFMDKKEAKER